MRKSYLHVSFVFIPVLIFAIYFYFFKETNVNLLNGKPVREITEKYYMNEDGFLHAYPSDKNSQYLSESIGLYLEYLVRANDADAFKIEVDKLEQKFIVINEGQKFIRWVILEPTNANALIDDVRIIAALEKASDLFNEPAYEVLANSLYTSLTSHLHQEGYYVDFFDWAYQTPSDRVVLSYLIPEFTAMLPQSAQTLALLKEINNRKQLFFPEVYDTKAHDFILAEEVHLIDQLLIAINRRHIGERSDKFDEWLINEWKTNHKLYGMYRRNSAEPSVNYESLAVYYYLYLYFMILKEEELAHEVIHQTKEVFKITKFSEMHFFDFIHGKQLLEFHDFS